MNPEFSEEEIDSGEDNEKKDFEAIRDQRANFGEFTKINTKTDEDNKGIQIKKIKSFEILNIKKKNQGGKLQKKVSDEDHNSDQYKIQSSRKSVRFDPSAVTKKEDSDKKEKGKNIQKKKRTLKADKMPLINSEDKKFSSKKQKEQSSKSDSDGTEDEDDNFNLNEKKRMNQKRRRSNESDWFLDEKSSGYVRPQPTDGLRIEKIFSSNINFDKKLKVMFITFTILIDVTLSWLEVFNIYDSL